jgi:hypothetical protein
MNRPYIFIFSLSHSLLEVSSDSFLVHQLLKRYNLNVVDSRVSFSTLFYPISDVGR